MLAEGKPKTEKSYEAGSDKQLYMDFKMIRSNNPESLHQPEYEQGNLPKLQKIQHSPGGTYEYSPQPGQ
ncbi:Uncharacterised protein [BD1-7 clade bacterium]|uniref:Uncharacterized protein n=1 Tax=BD1-7 clade bacterium TaxID=2029982 RepID=A0A5S9QSH8_9GAMM|nr:Uncharacterised protein [BD1-7 clade bacterium]